MFVERKILLVRGDVISWIAGLMLYSTGQVITMLKFRGYVNWWVGVTHEINEHPPYTHVRTMMISTVFLITIFWFYSLFNLYGFVFCNTVVRHSGSRKYIYNDQVMYLESRLKFH